MRRFALLYGALDATTSTSARTDTLAGWLASSEPGEAGAAVWLLRGGRLARGWPRAVLRDAACARAGLSRWLFDASAEAVGDFAETLALLVPPSDGASTTSIAVEGLLFPIEAPPPPDAPLDAWLDAMRRVADAPPAALHAWIQRAWDVLDPLERLVLNKVVTGAFRVGVSDGLVQRAAARAAGIEETVAAERLATVGQDWNGLWTALTTAEAGASGPLPVMLASPLEGPPASLGPRQGWTAEWKWDGIRALLVHRGGRPQAWSRSHEPLDAAFPDAVRAAAALPDGTVLDGELLAWRDGDPSPLPFAVLQRRLGRVRPTARLLSEVPVAFCAFDALMVAGQDLRERPLSERRDVLAGLTGVRVSPDLDGDWDALAALRASARGRSAEGLVLKRRDAPYVAGRHRGDWWKWKLDPYTLDAVLVGAQPGRGRRAGLYTDLTFAVWSGERLVNVARAYSGLDDAELEALDRWIRAHTVARHGPMRAVEPVLVFELAFEGLAPSTRHAAGIALRFPRIARRRTDKGAADADTLARVHALLGAHVA